MKEIKNITTKNTTKKTNTPKTKNTEPSCRILAQGYKVMNDQIASGLNGHDLIIGSTGAGKTGGYVVPNLLITDHSMVVIDTKNTLYRSYRRYLEKKGFRVVKIDFVHPEDSATYNMLDYIHTCEKASSRDENGEILIRGRNDYKQSDLKKIAKVLVPDEVDTHETFWADSARKVIVSLMAFVMECLPEEERHMGSVVELYIEMCEEVAAGRRDRDWEGVRFFKALEKDNPESFAVKMYKMYAGNFVAEKCWGSIEQFVSNALEVFTYNDTRNLFYGKSTINFKELGREKTILFLNVSDTDRSFDPIVNVLYTQLFQALCDEADSKPSEKLDVPVRIMMDDFASGVKIENFEKIITVIRSREIYVSIIMQSIFQMNTLYNDAQSKTIVNSCDCKIFLGGQDPDTARYLADMAGRLPESIMKIARDQVMLFIRGEEPKTLPKIKPYSITSENCKDEISG